MLNQRFKLEDRLFIGHNWLQSIGLQVYGKKPKIYSVFFFAKQVRVFWKLLK